MSFPSEKELKILRKKLQSAKGFVMLAPDANELERFRFDLCQRLLRYAQRKNHTTTEMAKLLKITKADMSRIFNHRIERFSTDKLINLYSKINPDYELKVA